MTTPPVETPPVPDFIVLGKPIRLLTDARLEAANALKAEAAAVAVGAIQQAIGAALDAVAIAEVLRYEEDRRAHDEAVILLRMVAANLTMLDRDGGAGLLSPEQIAEIKEWYKHDHR